MHSRMEKNKGANTNICVIIILYNSTAEQIKNVEALRYDYTVVAVDNSDEEIKLDNAHYISLHGNKGIAAAQNVGIKWAKEHGYRYVLLLDQDSKIDEDFVENLHKDFLRIKEIDSKVGFVGPVFVDEVSKQEYKNYTDKDEAFTKTSALIASGCLISMECLDIVGGMDESLFIDLVDFEWCWRAESNGYSGYMTRNVKMFHSIGKEYHNWYGFVLGISAPSRYYYQYRNTLWLIKRGYVPMIFKIKSVLRRLLDMVLVPIASKQGWQVLKNMVKGINDGLFKKNVLTY